MEKYHYYLVDVFTNQAFGGNPLAVFTDGASVPPEWMPKIAKELNLSETTFVMPPQEAANDFWLRIFTPAIELPMAGHPTVGTAYVLAKIGQIQGNEAKFEEGVGVIPVSIEGQTIFMRQPLPTFGEIYENRAEFAALLSLTEDDLDPQFPIQAVSCGVFFNVVPLKNMAAVARCKLRLDLWDKMLSHKGNGSSLFVFTQETVHAASTVHSRMFAPFMGIAEDSATGSASGPLGSYLVNYGIVSAPAQIRSEQGFEMGRPSLLHIRIEQTEGEISGVWVGGESVLMGEGFFYGLS